MYWVSQLTYSKLKGPHGKFLFFTGSLGSTLLKYTSDRFVIGRDYCASWMRASLPEPALFPLASLMQVSARQALPIVSFSFGVNVHSAFDGERNRGSCSMMFHGWSGRVHARLQASRKSFKECL